MTQKATRYYLYDQQKRVAELDQAGNIIQQYYYINNQPVAVLNTPNSAQQSDTNPQGLMAIHTDRRHAPVVVTNEQGQTIWQVQYNAWGRAIFSSPYQGEGWGAGDRLQNSQAKHQFNLALRLPGQWEDAVTHIHYNYQRDYNPDTGRYLTPDPLGFPDGPDPYVYVNNNPLNKLDPLGLYKIYTHYYMTYFLAIVAGVPKEQAQVMALATQYIDDNFGVTDPIGGGLDALKKYHFTMDYNEAFRGDGSNDEASRFISPRSVQLTKLRNSAYTEGISVCAKTQLFGEYLHALEDTFSHRDRYNVPYGVAPSLENSPVRQVGHVDILLPWAHGNHSPDLTFNQSLRTDYVDTSNGFPPQNNFVVDQWAYNELRTLEMQKTVFNEVREFAVSSGYLESMDDYYFHEWNDLAGDGTARVGLPGNQGGLDSEGKLVFEYKDGNTTSVLQRFNAYNEEAEGNSLEGKVRILNDWLEENAFSPIPVYNKDIAASNRDKHLAGLEESDVPGVILEFKPTNLVR